MTISRDIKIDIFDVIKSQVNAFGVGNDPEILLEFINDIWQLKRMPSTDSRYSDAEGDFIQHMIRNDDWDIDHIFLSRLNLIEDDDKFILFIENLLSAKYKVNSDEIIKFVLMIDPYLEKAGLKLAIE
ncbi:MAG: AbiJ-related protein [Bacteroidia bacterium]